NAIWLFHEIPVLQKEKPGRDGPGIRRYLAGKSVRCKTLTAARAIKDMAADAGRARELARPAGTHATGVEIGRAPGQIARRAGKSGLCDMFRTLIGCLFREALADAAMIAELATLVHHTANRFRKARMIDAVQDDLGHGLLACGTLAAR